MRDAKRLSVLAPWWPSYSDGTMHHRKRNACCGSAANAETERNHAKPRLGSTSAPSTGAKKNSKIGAFVASQATREFRSIINILFNNAVSSIFIG